MTQSEKPQFHPGNRARFILPQNNADGGQENKRETIDKQDIVRLATQPFAGHLSLRSRVFALSPGRSIRFPSAIQKQGSMQHKRILVPFDNIIGPSCSFQYPENSEIDVRNT